MGGPNNRYEPFFFTAAFLRMSPLERRAYLVEAAFDRGREFNPLPATLRALAIRQRHASQSWAKRSWSVAGDVVSIAEHSSPIWWVYHLVSGSDDEASDGLSRILSAVDKSLDAASGMMSDESLDIGNNLLHGIVPMLKTLAWWAAFGIVGGGAIGAVGGLGIFDAATIPEGMFLGFELAMTLGGYWALKDLLLEASKHLDRFTTLVAEAAELAWYAGEDGVVSEQHDINDAAKLFAFAIVELWWVVLQSLIILVLRKVSELGGEALGDVTAKVASKFGTSFGEWFAKNFEKIQKAVDERKNKSTAPEEGADQGGSGGGSSSAGGGSSSGSTQSSSASTATNAQTRLPQDVNVNSTPPAALPLNRPVGLSATQNAQVQADIAAARAQGATDFRVNQQQVNAAGDRVGINRPDLQYTDANGQRVYVEYDTPASNRGPLHEDRILANDPSGTVVLKTVP